MFSLPAEISVDALKKETHPAVEAHAERWALCLDAYDGDGGFLDGSYIWRFPRELDNEFNARKAQARYHNYAATLIDYYARKVYGKDIQRESTDEGLTAWWTNVDGAGTGMTSYLRQALAKALAAGYVGILADKTRDEATGPAKADEKSSVFLTRFLPTAILDWRLSRDEQLTAVKLLEDVPTDDLLSEDETAERIVLWDRDEWVRVADETPVERQSHGLGVVPLVALRPFRHARYSFIGRPLLGDGAILKALYNRASEQDNVLREQGFSLFVVTLPSTGDVDVEKAKSALGNEIGATRAVFAYGSATYETPSMEVPKTQEAHQQFLIKELYRMAHIPFETGSLDAQSAEAIRLQHEELTAVLAGVAKECHRVELELAKLYFTWNSATPELAARAFEAAGVQITYPEAFFEADPEKELAALVAASAAVESETFGQIVQKKIVQIAGGSLDADTIETIHNEIAAAEAKPDPMSPQTLRSGAEARLAAFVGQTDPDAEVAA